MNKKTLNLTAGIIAGSLATASFAFADVNPFGVKSVANPLLFAEAEQAETGKTKEGKCGEGKCGGDKMKSQAASEQQQPTEGKMPEGNCGGKTKEGSCGAKKK